MLAIKHKTYDYEFSLPWPPTLNTYRAVCRNRLITSAKGREYLKIVCWQIRLLKLNKEDIRQQILIHLTLHPKRNYRYDCSNFLKAYEDSLVASGFLNDDQYIEYGSIRKAEPVKGGKLDLKIELI